MQGVIEERLEVGSDIPNGEATGPARHFVDADYNRPAHRLGELLGVRTGPGHRSRQQLRRRLRKFRRQSDDLRQLTKAELVRAGQAPDVVAPKTLVPSGETRTSTAPADAMSPWSAAIRCSICRKTGGLTRSMPMS
jgi:hypothetical protein